MAEVVAGRMMAELDGDFVVFLIGMRIYWRSFGHLDAYARAGRHVTIGEARDSARQRLAARPGATTA
jgi:hypothetical protein